MEFINIILLGIITENILLTSLVGLDKDVLEVDKKLTFKTIISLIVVFLSSLVAYFINPFIKEYQFIIPLIYVVIILVVFLLTKLFLKNKLKGIYNNNLESLSKMLITTIVVGILIMLNTDKGSYIKMTIETLSLIGGLFLINYILNSIKVRLLQNNISKVLKGYPIILILLGIIALIVSRINIV